ncbi:EAL domain-containing protein [Enterovibrio makurazakiensis]|uniref:EAL domain-containing protein n=1 Tax=Enterovibrio makurazakiensis TaxID=2910232 RepID=UPI003D24BE3A
MRVFPSLRSYYDTYVRDISIVFLLILPLTICNAMSIFVGHALNFSNFPSVAKQFFDFSNMLIGVYPTVLCLISTYYLSSKHSVNPMVVTPYALAMFVTISLANGLVSGQNGLPNNPLVAILTSGVAAASCVSFRLYPLNPLRVDFVSSLYKQVAHFFGFLLLTMAFSELTRAVISYFDKYRDLLMIDPLTFDGGVVYLFILGALGSVGINGHNFLFRVKQQLFEDTQLNLSAWEAGEASLNILGQGFYDAFLSIGGSGNTLSLLCCILLFSKDRRHTALALSALPLVIFNINELLLFGLPIVFNPILIVPFILVPILSFVTVYGVMSLGWVNPVSTIVDWMTPPFLSGYIATQDSVGGVLLQVVVVALGVIVYRPFYLLYAGNSGIDDKALIRKSEIENSTMKSFLGDVNNSMGSYINMHEVSQRVSRMLSNGEFVMFYQPQVHLNDPEHLSFESLVRYKDEHGKLHPPTFVADFQQLRAMWHLDTMVIDLVLSDMKTFPLEKGCKIGVNVSADTISNPSVVDYITDRLAHYQLPATALEIEVTEEAILDDHTHIARNIAALQEMGVTVAIDDFGSGYASFPHLLKFNFDKVKLDRSLLLNVQEERGQNLYQLLAKISEVTGCEIVAEGVETLAEKQFVKGCDIEICQGYYFAKPLPLEEAVCWTLSADEMASEMK